MTPMFRQYHRLKAEHPGTLLFFRLGDFYEMFHEDAREASSLLGLTLTSREKGEEAVPMAGVPAKSVATYLRRLLQMGKKVAICEQMEDPEEAKGLVEREVVQVLTPGTVTDEELLEAGENNFLLAGAAGDGRAGLSWVDLSTGDFLAAEVPAREVLSEILRLRPAECLLPEPRAESPETESLARIASEAAGAAVTRAPPGDFEPDPARVRLVEQFGGEGPLADAGLREGSLALRAAGALLAYLQRTQKGALAQVTRIRRADPSDHLLLDAATQRNLELVRTMREGISRGTLLSVLDRTRTAMGARTLRGWLLSPLRRREAIEERGAAVAELFEKADLRARLREALEGILDLERLGARLACERATPRDLAALGLSLGRVPAVCDLLAQASSPLLSRLRPQDPVEDAGDRLRAALADAPPLVLTEGGIFREGFDAALDELRGLSHEVHDHLARFEAGELERTKIPTLKVGFNRVFGYYIEVTNPHRERIPPEYERRQTLKNAERYVTPELKAFEQKVLSAEERARKMEHRMFTELRAALAPAARRIKPLAEALGALDALASLAETAARSRWTRPEIAEGLEVAVEDGRHPVVEAALGAGGFVPNDLALDGGENRLLILTGPNMAGKSTYIRQAALLVILAQMGSFVPARKARIGWCDRVLSRVGASDDLRRGLSTFMVEMTETAEILSCATERSLVILDELGRGTSTYDGLSLAWATAEHLAEKVRCRALFATHYHELTRLPEQSRSVKNFNVAVREWGDEIVFLHRIVPGGTDRSYGIHVARLAGIPREVIDRARAILSMLEADGAAPPPPAGAGPRRGPVQRSLFEPRSHPVLEEIRRLDLDRMTPIEALERLADLRRRLGGGS